MGNSSVEIDHAKDVIECFCQDHRHVEENEFIKEHYVFTTQDYLGWNNNKAVSVGAKPVSIEEANQVLRQFCEAIGPDVPSSNQRFRFYPGSQ